MTRAQEPDALLALLLGAGSIVFTFRQDGNKLAGTVEGTGGGFFGGGDVPLPIEEGKVDRNNISFKAGNSTYSGILNADRIELQRKIDFGVHLPSTPAAPEGARPAIGRPRAGQIRQFPICGNA